MDWVTPAIVGNLIVAASIIFTAGGFYAVSRWELKRNREDMKEFQAIVKGDITDLKTDIKVLNRIVTDVALQNQRIAGIEKRLDEWAARMENRWDEIRRGEGLITR